MKKTEYKPMTERLEYLLQKSAELVWEGAKNLKKETPAFPEELFMELTYECPQKCAMCDVWPRYVKEPGLKNEELTFLDIQTLINNSQFLQKIKLVVLTGGEPFLRSDLVEICRFFLRKFPRLSLGILTSCFQPQNIVEKLTAIYNHCYPQDFWLGTSLDGLKNNHDRIRGVPGSFDRVMETISVVREKFPRKRIGVNFTILPSNYDDLLEVFGLCQEKNLEFSAQFPISWKDTPKFNWDEEALQNVENSIRQIMKHKVEEPSLINIGKRPLGDKEVDLLTYLFFWQNLVSYQRQPRRILSSCPAGWRYAMFNPQGGLYFCPQLKYAIVGNIKNDLFGRIWLSSRANTLREKIQSGNCHCWLNCSVYSFARAALKSLII